MLLCTCVLMSPGQYLNQRCHLTQHSAGCYIKILAGGYYLVSMLSYRLGKFTVFVVFREIISAIVQYKNMAFLCVSLSTILSYDMSMSFFNFYTIRSIDKDLMGITQQAQFFIPRECSGCKFLLKFTFFSQLSKTTTEVI